LTHLHTLNPEKVEWIVPKLEVLSGVVSTENDHP